MYPSYEYVKAGGADHIRNVDSGVEIGAQGPSANPGEHTWTRLDPNADRSAAMIVERIRLPYYLGPKSPNPLTPPPLSPAVGKGGRFRAWEGLGMLRHQLRPCKVQIWSSLFGS